MSNQLGYVRRPALERFMEKTEIQDNGCINWTGGLNGVGYGQFYRGRSDLKETGKTYAHRWSYEHFIGPIPEGLHLDHLCRNRRCVNPAHLEPVTIRENLLRGVGPSAIHARKTHCTAGHKYAGTNLYVRKNGERVCRECGKNRAQVARSKTKEK